MTLLTRSPYFRHWRLRAFFLWGLYKSCLVSNVCTSENADCFCPHVFDFCSSSCWRRLCGLSLFSSSWSPWGWITRLTNNMNVSILQPVNREKSIFRSDAVVLCPHNATYSLFCNIKFPTCHWKTKWLARVARKTTFALQRVHINCIT